MADYISTLFNGTDHSLRLLEVWGVWLSSIGTLAAVVVALWLGFRSERVDLQVSTNIVLFYPSNTDRKHLLIRAVNEGSRPVTVESISWTAGMFNWGAYQRKHGLMLVDSGEIGCSRLPIQLKDGEVANYFWETGRLFESLRMDLDKPFYRATLRFDVYTSFGRRFRVIPHKSVFEELNKDA